MNESDINSKYEEALDIFASMGVDTTEALTRLEQIPISIHCWQGDDLRGFETSQIPIKSDLPVTGDFPGRPGTIEELQSDLEKVLSLIPGRHRLNLHSSYGDFKGKNVKRNEIDISHFSGWAEWARELGIKLDFNATLFSHPLASSGYTLSSSDAGIRKFWQEHVLCSRRITSELGRMQKSPAMHNLWIPDGSKDIPADRLGPRRRLLDSLNQIYSPNFPVDEIRDSVESKLFGIGSESYVVGSHDFYLAFALKREIIPCLDMGHYHPTESVADKLSALLLHFKEILLHVSRGVRWDSDHVPVLDDELHSVTKEICRDRLEDRVFLALDFFDASINRIGAYVSGCRSLLKGLLVALLEPTGILRAQENRGHLFQRLALLEEFKFLPYAAVWDYYCLQKGVPPGSRWIEAVESYERQLIESRK